MSAWSEWRAAVALRIPAPMRRAWRAFARLVGATFSACFRYRVTGLAAEAAFFAILSLPPLIFGLAGAVGFVARRFDPTTITSFRDQLLSLASRVLNPESVQAIIAPTLNDVLSVGRYSVISVGFILALWSGSRAVNVFLDTIAIMYGLGGKRSIVRTRTLSFLFYLAVMIIGAVLIPLLLIGPTLLDRLLPQNLSFIGLFYWPVVLLGSVVFLTTLYHVALPVRSRWVTALPGAGLSLVIWLLGSALLRFALGFTASSTTIYGPLAAPIAVLIWLYLLALAILIGAAFNSAVDVVWPRATGIDHRQSSNTPETENALEARVAAGMAPALSADPVADPQAVSVAEALTGTAGDGAGGEPADPRPSRPSPGEVSDSSDPAEASGPRTDTSANAPAQRRSVEPAASARSAS